MGCDLFIRTGRGNEYKPNDDWWLIEEDDFLKKVENPVMEKVSKNRIKYHFNIEKRKQGFIMFMTIFGSTVYKVSTVYYSFFPEEPDDSFFKGIRKHFLYN